MDESMIVVHVCGWWGIPQRLSTCANGRNQALSSPLRAWNINIHPQILALINELWAPMGTCLGKIWKLPVACNTVPCPASCLKLSVILGMRLVADSSLVPRPSFLLLSIWEGDSADFYCWTQRCTVAECDDSTATTNGSSWRKANNAHLVWTSCL